jgi:hypothetical protein
MERKGCPGAWRVICRSAVGSLERKHTAGNSGHKNAERNGGGTIEVTVAVSPWPSTSGVVAKASEGGPGGEVTDPAWGCELNGWGIR